MVADRVRIALLFVVLGWGAGCTGAPSFDETATRRSAERVAETFAAEAQDELAVLAVSVTHAERITAAERALPRWRRSAGRIEAAWARVEGAAASAEAAGKRRRRLDIERWTLRALEAESAVRLARTRRDEAQLGRDAAAFMARAEAKLDAARKLASAGEPRAAVQLADAVLAETAGIDAAWRRMHARFEDPDLRRIWRDQARSAIAASRTRPALVVDKLARRLDVYRDGRLVQSLPAELGSRGLERKLREGDRATPEGVYRVSLRKQGGQTRYYKALLIDYPNAEDLTRYREHVRKSGERFAGPGGLIEIHGGGGQGRDWTDGCIALTNEDMDRLFEYAGEGTPVAIVGTYAG